MEERIILALFLSFLGFNQGCQIGGNISLGPVPQQLFIKDIFRDNIISEATTDIVGITSINYGGALTGGPYLDITHVDSQFVVRPSGAFEQYEENEVAMFISVTVTFSCTDGSTSPLILVINIQDTNNNDPQFRPSNEFEFVVAPPLPPGFLVTGCNSDITVRDIDLTTSRIIFEIEDNPYFEIEYDAVASAAAPSKEFKALLKTSTFIRNLREPVTLTITATDVDATGDPSRNASGTIRISGDTEFEFPEEPVFSQTFYIAQYTNDHQLILSETISLQQGFDANVNFTLDGEYSSYFTLTPIGNQVSLVVNSYLPVEVLAENQIYLIVRASREYTSGASATVVIYLPEETPLLFSSALYEGAIVDSDLKLSSLVLSQGYEGVSVTAEIIGEHATRFTAIVQENLVNISMAPIVDSFIQDNSFISMQVVASTDRSEATTIVSLEIIKDDNVTPAFDKSIYTGSYDPDNGLTIEQITFIQGFDETVSVELVGEHERFFQIIVPGPTVNLSSSTIPPELFAEQRITFSIEASKQRTVGASAVIIIALPSARQMEFGMPTYRGTILDSQLTIQTILLNVGYDQSVQFNLSGDYSTYFDVTNVENQVTITLPGSLPDSVVTQNSLMLTLTATGLNALATTTSVLLDILKNDTTTPVFSQNIYHGVYHSSLDFEIDNIFLTQGFDDQVSFRLDDSAHAQYFTVSSVGSNVTVALRSTIPEHVIFQEKVLLFNILADKPLTVGSNSAILIRFPAELTDVTVMKFTKSYYLGVFEQNNITVESIILETGYADGTQFLLLGEYAQHFQISNTNNVVQISNNISNSLPSEIDDNFIILTVETQRDGAVSAWASVVIEIVKKEIIHPVFNQAFYRGSYTVEDKLRFEENIHIVEGYDENVTFHLQGNYATWFSVSQTGNSVTLVLDSDIPPSIMQDNNQLLFSIIALNINGASGRAVISIDLPKGSDIRFSQEYYKGYIENGLLTLDAITLQDISISIDIIPTITGDYSEYFQVRNLNGSLILEIQNPLPTDLLDEKRSLILTLSIPYGISEISTVIVLEVVRTEILPLEFVSLYYVGSYNETQGLKFDNEIKINDDDFDSVVFELEGNDAIWFGLVRGESSIQLKLTEVIPPSVIISNHQLIFAIRAERSGSTTVRATIVISIHTGFIEALVLGFDRVSYLGSINTNQSTIETITLREGYDIPGVELILHGELSGYFNSSRQGSTITVTLETPIPEQSIPANRIILLGIQASAPEAIPAYATLVLEYLLNNNVTSVELVFARTYYTGTYAPSPGLTFITPISLAEGYDADVQFSLEGDDAGWFDLEGTGNSRQLVLSSPIPTGVLANNQQLVFIVNAQRPGSTPVRATIVISLEPEFTEGFVLGFDRVSYLGSVENNLPTIEPITLREGYDLPGVQLELLGDLSGHFNVSRQGTAITVTLEAPISEQSIPANRIILLGIQASAPEAIPAYATLVLEYLLNNNVTSVELIFARTYYTGTYAPSPGLTFITPISLAEGYDADVQFSLEGDDAGWFDLEGTGNSRQLVLSSPIPTGVLANNQQLVFIVNAQRPGSTTVRATIVISLEPEFTEGFVLGFDRVSYLGSVENNLPTIEPITLREGYDLPGVQLELLGDLSGHFNVSRQGTAITVTLEAPIPEQSIPANRIILLGIQASAPEAIPAYATLVLEYLLNNNVTSVELIFARTYYTGTYAPSPGLTFITPISLAEGYDADVQFSLEGDDAGWFDLEGTGNSRQLVLSSPIPTGVLANNQQLVFIVNAQRPGSTTVRATIVISLEPEFTEGFVLGFDRVSYLGSVENNLPTIEPITLREGYDLPGVQLELLGDLSGHFNVSRQGTAITVTLEAPIPEQSIPANRIILLGIQASAPEAIPAYATLVLEYLLNNNVTSVELIFARTYYTGTYAPSPGLTFITPISLAEGYDANVQFSLEGDDAGWFDLEGTGNSRQLVLSSPIPTGVLANNQQLVFIVNAQRPGSTTVRATIVISLEPEFTEGFVLGFDRVSYLGSVENNLPTIEPITLREGYDLPGVQLELLGDLSGHFNVSRQGTAITVTLEAPIPEQSIPANRIILLGIQASAPEAIPAYATLVLEYLLNNNVTSIELVFARTYYTGTYAPSPGLTFITPISLAEGYDADVQFSLEGDDAGWFDLEGTGNSRQLVLSSPIPTGVLANNQQLVFIVNAQKPGSTTVRATIVISLEPEFTEGFVLGFDRVSYLGSVENNLPTIEPITLREGYDLPGVQLELLGDLSGHFNVSRQGTAITVTLEAPIPEQSIPANRIILLGIQASAPEAIPAYATLVLEYLLNNNVTSVELVFARTYYTGTYAPSPGLTFITPISLAEGYDANVQFSLEGDDAGWFDLEGTGNSRQLVLSSPIPTGVLANNQQLVFIVNAQRPGSATVRATIVISLEPEFTEGFVLGFDRVSYLGSVENNLPTIEPITLREGYDLPGVQLELLGDLSGHFNVSRQGITITVTLEAPIPEQSIPANRIILLGIQASAPEAIPAYATLVLEYLLNNNVTSVELVFARTYYTGTYAPSPGLTFITPISLAEGYDADVQFSLEGDDAGWFDLEGTGNLRQLVLSSPIPTDVFASNQQLVFVVIAERAGSTTARATIVISLINDSQAEPDVYFEKTIFQGVIQNGVVRHEPISLFGFTGTVIELVGEFSPLFEASVANGLVTVSTKEPFSLPQGTTHLALELQAGTAKSVLIFDVIQNEVPPTTPVVTFSAASYAVRVEVTETGLVGRVQAEADNGEAVRYSLQLTSEHLQQRLSVNDLGELHLSAPVSSGRYTFLVVATTVFTQATGNATVYLSAEAVTICGEDIVMPPLIVLDRDEEEPHYNLVNAHEGCHFSLSNRWPEDQSWLYVNETGLHTSSIDREHESIAFMALSQVQVEITLHCDTDATRIKRSMNSEALTLNDFGTSKWVLTDTILYNSRRSLVNLIVNDINDNAPIFEGKDQEPIAVGYPVPELEEKVLPRSLAELQATDADIGENAELMYWSSESVLAVAPTTGFVHVRDTAILEHGSRLTVNATDRNGQGLTGSIDIVVRLLDQSNILVVTVRDVFLHDENNVLSRLSDSVGYEIKVLRSVVISNEEINGRIKREATNPGASLQLYVYGLIEREPVTVERLTADINAAIVEVNIASTVSLEDHLAAQEICAIPGRDTGLLVATIVLSVLLFIIIVLIAVWFFLRWRREKNYNQFSDANSIASRNESVADIPKPVEVATKPRLNIEELKKSERRLRDLLEGSVEDVPVEPTTPRNDSILDMPLPTDTNTPIVIQSIDKLKDAADDSSDDEFGERKKPTRKSVVTFNENVEKIIHVEETDPDDLSTSPGYEIYKL